MHSSMFMDINNTGTERFLKYQAAIYIEVIQFRLHTLIFDVFFLK